MNYNKRQNVEMSKCRNVKMSTIDKLPTNYRQTTDKGIEDFWSYNEWREINWTEVLETRQEE